MKKRKFAVIGLNTFGVAVMQALGQLGHERIGIDIDRSLVQKYAADLHDVVEADATQIEALQAAGVDQCDCAVVALGTNLAASILVTLSLKQIGVPFVAAKARSETHAEALKRVGADLVVFPERDSARHLAKQMMFTGFLDVDPLTDSFSLVKVKPLRSMVGKMIKDIQLRSRLGLNIILIERADGTKVEPDPTYTISATDTLYIAGRDTALENYSRQK